MESFSGISLPMQVLLCLLVGMAGFVDASAGGGGLISLPAYLFAGLPAHMAYGCNKMSSAMGTTFAAAQFFRSGALDLRVALLSAAASFAGSTLASRVVLLLSDALLQRLVLLVIPLAAILIFTRRDLPDENRTAALSRRRSTVLALVIGFFIGGYDGLIGPGTGTFAIIAYAAVMGFDLRSASGNAKVLNLASNYASLVTYLLAGTVNLAIALPCGICSILGSLLGSWMALHKGARFIRPMLLVVLALLLCKLAGDILL